MLAPTTGPDTGPDTDTDVVPNTGVTPVNTNFDYEMDKAQSDWNGYTRRDNEGVSYIYGTPESDAALRKMEEDEVEYYKNQAVYNEELIKRIAKFAKLFEKNYKKLTKEDNFVIDNYYYTIIDGGAKQERDGKIQAGKLKAVKFKCWTWMKNKNNEFIKNQCMVFNSHWPTGQIISLTDRIEKGVTIPADNVWYRPYSITGPSASTFTEDTFTEGGKKSRKGRKKNNRRKTKKHKKYRKSRRKVL